MRPRAAKCCYKANTVAAPGAPRSLDVVGRSVRGVTEKNAEQRPYIYAQFKRRTAHQCLNASLLELLFPFRTQLLVYLRSVLDRTQPTRAALRIKPYVIVLAINRRRFDIRSEERRVGK